MRLMKAALLAVSLPWTLSLSFAQQAPAPQRTSTEPAVLGDGAGAKYMRVDNMHQVRYIEIFLAGREAKTGNMVAACYNTIQGYPPVERHRPAGPGRGSRFRKDEEGIRRPRCVVERPQTLAA